MRFPSLLEHFVLVVNLTFVYVERPIAVVVWAYTQHLCVLNFNNLHLIYLFHCLFFFWKEIIKIRNATLWPRSEKVEGGMRIDSAQFSGFTNYPLSSCSFPLSSVLAYLGFCISLSRARLRLSQFRIRLSLSWLSLTRAPTGVYLLIVDTASVVQGDCEATLCTFRSENAEASSLGLCWAAAHIRRCISNATAKVQHSHCGLRINPQLFFDFFQGGVGHECHVSRVSLSNSGRGNLHNNINFNLYILWA